MHVLRNDFRRAYFQSIADSLRGGAAPDISSIYLMYSPKDARRIAGQCQSAWLRLSHELGKAVDRLAEGAAVEDIIGPGSVGVVPYRFPASELGTKATAIADAARLIVSMDPAPFVCHASGDGRREVLAHLNRGLNDLAARREHEWREVLLQKVPLYQKPLAGRRAEDSSLRVMFLTVCMAFWPGANFRNPLEDRGAELFAESFRAKAWPVRGEGYLPESTGEGWSLEQLDASLQEWWFSVGKTQVEPPTPAALRRAEEIFVAVREIFHESVRACREGCETACAHAIVGKAVDLTKVRAGGEIFTDAIRGAVIAMEQNSTPGACEVLLDS